jgi:hypothetical protein
MCACELLVYMSQKSLIFAIADYLGMLLFVYFSMNKYARAFWDDQPSQCLVKSNFTEISSVSIIRVHNWWWRGNLWNDVSYIKTEMAGLKGDFNTFNNDVSTEDTT